MNVTDRKVMMGRTALICSTAWKESMTPSEACRLMADALSRIRPDWFYQCLPLADGGDGWLDCLSQACAGTLKSGTVITTGPLPNQPVEASYRIDSSRQRLFLESAEIHGLRRLPHGERAPMAATSFGIGEALRVLLARYPQLQDVVISVGGSASTDGGLGFLQALGWQFYDAEARLLTSPVGAGDLARVVSLQPPSPLIRLPDMTILTDVNTVYADSPRWFGPQKGVPPEQIAPLTEAFHRLGRLLNPSEVWLKRPGTGAAGGLPFGLLIACPEARIESGVAWTAELLGFEGALQAADSVITGEGRFDETSMMGKVTGYVVKAAQRLKKPVLVICGQSPFERAFALGVQVEALFAPNESVSPEAFAETPERLISALSVGLSAIE